MAALNIAFLLLCAVEVFSDGPSGCPVYSFRCSSGQCIKETSVCDGAKDCHDGSDETQATCSRLSVECPAYAFRCAYGACVDKNKICDDIQDCADNSDELLPECKKNLAPLTNTVCKKHEFTCNSGACIDETLLCDGSSDCYDASDETITQCINVRCPGYSFQCAYGACIDKDKKCNGVEECKDGSDEDDDLCEAREVTSRKPFPHTSTYTPKPLHLEGCPLPEKPRGGYYDVVECSSGDTSAKCRKVPGTIVKPFTIIRFHCQDGFALPGNGDTTFCNKNGKWDPEPQECNKLCPALKSDSLELRCYYLGSPVNCSAAMNPGTLVKVRCKPAFHLEDFSSGFTETECLSDGTWAHPLFSCRSDCGIKNAVKQLISHAPVAESVYPWHAGLYKNYGQDYICGGSIITEKAIVTAAHCVYNEKQNRTIDREDFRVAVGKFRRSWNLRDTNEQRFMVHEIIIRDTYLGNNNRYEHDIAILAISGTITVKPSVMPVCIDRFSKYHIKQSDQGTVVGWGNTEKGTTSNELRVTKLPYYNFHACRKSVSESFSHFITYDKFCAGLRNGTQLGHGDSGGGLTFPSTNNNDNKEIHFLYGIVSVTDPNNHDLTAFTNVTVHVSWLDKVLTAIKMRRDKV